MVVFMYGAGDKVLRLVGSLTGGGSNLMVQSYEDRELVGKAATGDKESFRLLVERYEQRARRVAYEVVLNTEDAEDVVQEAFVKAYLSMKNFRGDSSFYTWIYRIVYNVAIDFKRKISRERRFGANGAQNNNGNGTAVVESVPSFITPQYELERKEYARRIQEALSGLSEEHRTVMLLREVDGMRYEQIAEVVGVSKGTVMSRLHYARKRVQESLKDLIPKMSLKDVEEGSSNVSRPLVDAAKR